MKRNWERWFRLYLAALLILLGWSVWRTMAQSQPDLKLIEPEHGARFDPGTNITLRANVSATFPAVRQLEFLRGGTVLGIVSNAPYVFVWNDVPSGTYTLAARAVLQAGGEQTSEVIQIRIYDARLTFGLDQIPFLEQHKLFEIPLWQYCASLIYVFLAFYVSKLLDYLTRVWLKKFAGRTSTRFDDLLLDLLNGPIKIVAFVIFLRIGLEVFSWPALVQGVLSKALSIIVAMSLTYMVLKFIDLVMGYWRERNKGETDAAFDQQLFPILRKSLKVFVIIVAVLVTLSNIGVDITAAIASLSIGGLAVGLAAQDTLANLFGAVAVFVDKPFRIGDAIRLEGVDGTVEAIGLRSTRVRNLDGHLITIPNKTMGNATITNVTRRPTIKTEMNFGLTYDTPAPKVKRAIALLEEIYRGHPMTGDLVISFNKFADSSLNILVVHWWKNTDMRAYLAGMQELNLTIKERFDAEGIGFAFPSRTVYVRQDSDWRVQGNGQPAR